MNFLKSAVSFSDAGIMTRLNKDIPKIEIDEIRFENVSLSLSKDQDPVLSHVDYNLPTDDVLVIESSNPQNASWFLKLIAGQVETTSGQILWNGEAIFNEEGDISPSDFLGCYFENYRPSSKDTFMSVWQLQNDLDVYTDVVEHFDLQDVHLTDLKKLPYGLQKLAYLVASVIRPVQVLVLEDPATGLTETQWLTFLDYVQLRQRQGFARHIFITNHHPTALRHTSFNRIILEEGLIYVDEALRVKKASHF